MEVAGRKSFICIHTLYICVAMARQISVSNDVYMELYKRKGKRSFSEVIRSAIEAKNDRLKEKTGKQANEALLKLMEKGFPLGRIKGDREEWHGR